MSFKNPDRLVILIASGTKVDSLLAHLVRENFNFTVIKSTGGLLQEPEVCLLVGFERIRMMNLLDIVRTECRPYRHYVSTQGTLQGVLSIPLSRPITGSQARLALTALCGKELLR